MELEKGRRNPMIEQLKWLAEGCVLIGFGVAVLIALSYARFDAATFFLLVLILVFGAMQQKKN
jgi:transcriptional regulator with XRE-family HTH domain